MVQRQIYVHKEIPLYMYSIVGGGGGTTQYRKTC